MDTGKQRGTEKNVANFSQKRKSETGKESRFKESYRKKLKIFLKILKEVFCLKVISCGDSILASVGWNQGCQMVCFQTKNPKLGKSLVGL
jgi:hypothetical protein